MAHLKEKRKLHFLFRVADSDLGKFLGINLEFIQNGCFKAKWPTSFLVFVTDFPLRQIEGLLKYKVLVFFCIKMQLQTKMANFLFKFSRWLLETFFGEMFILDG